MSIALDVERLWRVIDVGRGVLWELDEDAVLDRILETARQLTGARYAALGVLNEERSELQRFVTQGIDEQTRRAIGKPPRSRLVLGAMVTEACTLVELTYGQPAHTQARYRQLSLLEVLERDEPRSGALSGLRSARDALGSDSLAHVRALTEGSCLLTVGDQVASGTDPKPAVTAGAVKVYERTAHSNGVCTRAAA